MDEEVKTEIQAVLLLLKSSLIRNGVSAGVMKDTGKIFFFDTATYLSSHEYKGFSVDLNDLVK